MPQRLLTFALLSLAATAGVSDASALGFGRSQPAAVLGQPLDFHVALRVDGSEVLAPGCVSAEVTVGDVVLPRTSVGASLETVAGAASVRVRTSTTVDEPVVSVLVTAGCDGKVSRRFTLFADPPGIGLAPAAAVAAETMLVPVPASVSAEAAADSAAVAAPVQQDRRPDVSARAAAPPRAEAPVRPPVARASKPPKVAAASQAPKAAKRARPVVARAELPRLRLDPPGAASALLAEATVLAAERQVALSAAEQAASAAQASAAAAASRVAALESGLSDVKREAQAQREQLLRLGEALAEAEARSRWMPLLWAAVAALLVIVGGLWLKLRASRGERAQAWWNEQRASADANDTDPAAADAALSHTPSARGEPADALRRLSAHDGDDQAMESAVERTAVLEGTASLAEPPARDVSIDELLDLEQQAEFFIVLGQDTAAIELLVEHLRSTGGTSPLPYLKLMDIYRRVGDESAYGRTRDRFNHRFNAIAPAWAADVRAGRTLEGYPDVVAQLQRSWPRPMDAMAELETLLFRSDGHQLFELPAYREVLFLYSLARDLCEQGEQGSSNIDVLLPLATKVDLPFDDLATAPVDLDLTEPEASPTVARATSQFGFFEETTTRVG